MDLHIVWFILIVVLFTGFFILEGFDYGVGGLLPFLSRGDRDRSMILRTITPVWDGNEVWMITAGGALFASFPHVYATMFSTFYLALFLMLFALILRGVAFEFRGRRETSAWRHFWEGCIAFGSILPAILCIMVLLFLLAMQMANRLTHQIVAPLDHMAEKIQKMDTPTVDLTDDDVYEELRPFVNSVKQSQQVREEFSANVSHELKTPLTSISGFAELMKDGMVTDAAHVREFSTTIYDESQRLLALIDDIMHLSRLEAGVEMEQEPVNLYLLSETIIHRLRDKAMKHQVSIDLSGGSAEITGVRTNIEEMIYNLIDNSIKYNHPNGHVYVICEGRSITVQDDGIGIPEEDLNRVWERFFRVDKSHSRAIGGTGLGLSIVKHVAELHHAKVDISSQLNRGTKITITFPK